MAKYYVEDSEGNQITVGDCVYYTYYQNRKYKTGVVKAIEIDKENVWFIICGEQKRVNVDRITKAEVSAVEQLILTKFSEYGVANIERDDVLALSREISELAALDESLVGSDERPNSKSTPKFQSTFEFLEHSGVA